MWIGRACILIRLFSVFWKHYQKRMKTFFTTIVLFSFIHQTPSNHVVLISNAKFSHSEEHSLGSNRKTFPPHALSTHTWAQKMYVVGINKNVSRVAFPKINWQRRECRLYTRELALGQSHTEIIAQDNVETCYLISSQSPLSRKYSLGIRRKRWNRNSCWKLRSRKCNRISFILNTPDQVIIVIAIKK